MNFCYFILPIVIIAQFPLFVLTGTKLIAILPISVLILIYLSRILNPKATKYSRKLSTIPFIFCLVLMVQIYAYTTVGRYPSSESFRLLGIILLSLGCYYIPGKINRQHISLIYKGLFFITFVSTLFYVTDQVLLMYLGYVQPYQERVIEYTMRQLSIDDKTLMNLARVSPYYRSHGLYDKHSFSAFITVIFLIIWLTRSINLSSSKLSVRIVITFLLIFFLQNYTAMFGFTICLLSFIFFDVLNRLKVISNLFWLGVLSLLSSLVIDYNSNILEPIFRMVKMQLATVFTDIHFVDSGSFWGEYLSKFSSYFHSVPLLPIIFGDGASSFYGYVRKGGDHGWYDSLATLGFLQAVVLVSFLVYKALFSRKIRLNANTDLMIAACIILPPMLILYTVLVDIHYSIWFNKMVLPVIFLVLRLREEAKRYI